MHDGTFDIALLEGYSYWCAMHAFHFCFREESVVSL